MPRSTLHQNLDVELRSLKPQADVSSFSCDPTGRYSVLGDASGLVLLDLEYPFQRPRVYYHQTKAKVDCLRWNPHLSHQDHVASTSQSQVLIWRLDHEYRPLAACLRKHTKAVKDMAWSPELPDILATAGLDGALHLWDVRSHQAPCQSFLAGANKPAHRVSWSTLSPQLLATGHEAGEVCLWDTRRPSARERFVTQGGALSSLDWNPYVDAELVTSSQDSSVVFWDVSTAHDSSNAFTASEVLTLRSEDRPRLLKFTPFGQCGLTSVGRVRGYQRTQRVDGQGEVVYLWALPASKARSAESLQLVQRYDCGSPVVGYDWRVVDDLVYQLMTLDEAQHLRLWRIDSGVLRACGHSSRSEGVIDDDALGVAGQEGGGPAIDKFTSMAPPGGAREAGVPPMTSKLSLDTLKTDLMPLSAYAPPPRLSAQTSKLAAGSVWQEMIEVEELARRGELPCAEVEMVDSMSRTIRLSLGTVPSPGSSHAPLKRGGSGSPSRITRSAMISVSRSSSDESESRSPRYAQGGLRLVVTVEFPSEYPFGATPRFTFKVVRDDEEEQEEDDGGDDGTRPEPVVEANEAVPDSGRPTLGRKSSTGLLNPLGREMLMREADEVARAALDAQQPCLELCIRHLAKVLRDSTAGGMQLLTAPSSSTSEPTTPQGQKTTSQAQRVEVSGSDRHSAFEAVTAPGGGPDVSINRFTPETPTTARSSLSRMQRDHQLPCPRYSGAVFSGSGALVLVNCHLTTGARAGHALHAATNAGPPKAHRQRPPRTYSNLMRRVRGGTMRKGFLTAAETPLPGMARPKGPLARDLGAERESSRSTPQRLSRDSELDSADSMEEVDTDGSSDSDDDTGGASGGSLYSSYFMSPQSRLPLNHPDHDYSLGVGGEAEHGLGLEMGLGLSDLGVDSLAVASALAPCSTQAPQRQSTSVTIQTRPRTGSFNAPSGVPPPPPYPKRRASEPHHASFPVMRSPRHADTSVSPRSPDDLPPPPRVNPPPVVPENSPSVMSTAMPAPSLSFGSRLQLPASAGGAMRRLVSDQELQGKATSSTPPFSMVSLRRHNSLETGQHKVTIASDYPGSNLRPARRIISSAALNRENSVPTALSMLGATGLTAHAEDSVAPPRPMLSRAASAQSQHQYSTHDVAVQQRGAVVPPAPPEEPDERNMLLLSEAREISDNCRVNAEACLQGGKRELCKIWSALRISTRACVDAVEYQIRKKGRGGAPEGNVFTMETLRPWREGPLGKALVDRLLSYLEWLGDVQTLATIICVLNTKHPYSLLHDSTQGHHDRYLHAYAELLYRWGALEQRADVLKHVTSLGVRSGVVHDDSMSIDVRCGACGDDDSQKDGFCLQCRGYSFRQVWLQV